MCLIRYKHYERITGIDYPLGTFTGGGISLPHNYGIVINPQAVIGNHCTIFQGVTIGSMRGKGVPKIGDDVVIFSGAKVVGNIKVGNHVVIGANAVVTKDVPENAVVVGIPAKVINFNGPEITILY